MMKTELRLPELGLIVGTRALLGAGIGLLAADHLEGEQRRRLGRALVAIGLVTTIPLAALTFRRRVRPAPALPAGSHQASAA